MLQTEFEFELPSGYADASGNLVRSGTMRLATALDEVEPMQDPRVRANGAYLSIVMLSRVVTRLGGISPVGPAIIENLFSEDFLFLQDLYLRLNKIVRDEIETVCPVCSARFTIDLTEEQDV